MTLLLGVILILSDTFEQRPAFHIAALTFLPVLLSSIRSSIRLIGVTEALPAGRSQLMGQAWIYILLAAFIPVLLYHSILLTLSSHAKFVGGVWRTN